MSPSIVRVKVKTETQRSGQNAERILQKRGGRRLVLPAAGSRRAHPGIPNALPVFGGDRLWMKSDVNAAHLTVKPTFEAEPTGGRQAWS